MSGRAINRAAFKSRRPIALGGIVSAFQDPGEMFATQQETDELIGFFTNLAKTRVDAFDSAPAADQRTLKNQIHRAVGRQDSSPSPTGAIEGMRKRPAQ